MPIATRPSHVIDPPRVPAFAARAWQTVKQSQTLIEARAGSTERLAVGLEADGHDVSVANATQPSRILPRGIYDLIVLCHSAPEIAEWIRLVRDRDERALVLAIADQADETDLVLGLRLGADAYVMEPYRTLELLARIEALLRRYRWQAQRANPSAGSTVRFGDVELNERYRMVSKRGVPVVLSPKELAVLLALVRRQGAVAARADLLREVWGQRDSRPTRTVDVHIAELRRKLEDDASAPRYILTERRMGYRLTMCG